MINNLPFQDMFVFAQWFVLSALFIWAYRIWHSEFVGAYRILRHIFIEIPRRRRGSRMVKLALHKGGELVFNSLGGVIAVCRIEDFYQAKRTWIAKIESEKDPKKNLEMKLTKPQFKVFPVFTFSSTETRLPLHTGSEMEMKGILADLVEKVTGEKKYRVSRKHYDQAVKYLVRRDARLHVPFTKDQSGRYQAADEITLLSQLTLENAKTTLLG